MFVFLHFLGSQEEEEEEEEEEREEEEEWEEDEEEEAFQLGGVNNFFSFGFHTSKLDS